MSETPNKAQAEQTPPKTIKDKHCQFCGQAFTSSSLGRHLDLYIRRDNPKAPDGIHIVETIRQLRGSVTRRQYKNSASSSRRYSMTSTATPTATSKKSPAESEATISTRSPLTRKGSAAQMASAVPGFNVHRWETTGVINDIPHPGDDDESRLETGRVTVSDREQDGSHGMDKSQLDMMKKKVQDAMDTARAAELALREMISSWRAAKRHIDMTSMPFDFDPLSLDFPALTLQCLPPPPTLFSLHPFSAESSWSIQPPGPQQYTALCTWFGEEFRKWRITCAAATTAVQEDIQYPPSQTVFKDDARETLRRAEKQAEDLEKKVNNHLQTAFDVWEQMPPDRKQESWVIELARSVCRKHKRIEAMQDEDHILRQENANLKSQLEHLNRLQQPREFKIMPPATFPIPRKFLEFWHEEGVVHGRRGIGLNMDDRHSDLGTVVSTAIDRWKHVIVSTRAPGTGTGGKRTLDQTDLAAEDHTGGASASALLPSSRSTQNKFRVVSTADDRPRPMAERADGLTESAVAGRAADAQAEASRLSGPVVMSGTTVGTTTPSAPASVATRTNTDGAEDMGDSDIDAAADADGDDGLSDRDAHAEKDDRMSDRDADAEMDDDDALGYSATAQSSSDQAIQARPVQKRPGGPPGRKKLPQANGRLDLPRTRLASATYAAVSNGTAGNESIPSGTRSLSHGGHGGPGGIDISMVVPFEGHGNSAMRQVPAAQTSVGPSQPQY